MIQSNKTSPPTAPALEDVPREASALTPGLYVVATPIGNLGDITMRALEVLKGVDVIACEDTRMTRRLVRHYGITTRLTPYHDHNAAQVRPQMLEQLEAGARIALVSDAGTPLISDPGYRLVREAQERGIRVIPIPGASAVISALSAAGMPTSSFLFKGFLPTRKAQRHRAITACREISASLVFYETGRRLAATLGQMAEILGPREAVVARELTKIYEEFRRGNLDALAVFYHDAPPPKGEIVLIVAPPADLPKSQADLDQALGAALQESSLREAVGMVAAQTGIERRRVYRRALELKGRV